MRMAIAMKKCTRVLLLTKTFNRCSNFVRLFQVSKASSTDYANFRPLSQSIRVSSVVIDNMLLCFINRRHLANMMDNTKYFEHPVTADLICLASVLDYETAMQWFTSKHGKAPARIISYLCYFGH